VLKDLLDHQEHKVFPVLKVLEDQLVEQDQQAQRVSQVLQEHLVLKVRPAHKALKEDKDLQPLMMLAVHSL
jgi:hypothetical protein